MTGICTCLQYGSFLLCSHGEGTIIWLNEIQQWFSEVQQCNARLFSGAVSQNFVSLCKHRGLRCDFENDLYLNT